MNWSKFQQKVDNQSRFTLDGYGSYKNKFVSRLSMGLRNRTFKMKILDKVYYGMFLKCSVKSTRFSDNEVFTYSHCGFTFYHGHNNSRYVLRFADHSLTNVELIVHINDLREAVIEEIPNEQFYNVCKLFMM